MLTPTSDIIARAQDRSILMSHCPYNLAYLADSMPMKDPVSKKPKCIGSKEQLPRLISGFYMLTQMSMFTHKRIHEKQNTTCVSCLAQSWAVVLLPAQSLVGFPFSLMSPSR